MKKTFTTTEITRLFGRIHESVACPKHGAGSLAVCPGCDVVTCRSCGRGCMCPDTSESAIKGLLREIVTKIKSLPAGQKWMAEFNEWMVRAEKVVRTPED